MATRVLVRRGRPRLRRPNLATSPMWFRPRKDQRAWLLDRRERGLGSMDSMMRQAVDALKEKMEPGAITEKPETA